MDVIKMMQEGGNSNGMLITYLVSFLKFTLNTLIEKQIM
jgi:hypothetical protein